jgi:hypothetical protein
MFKDVLLFAPYEISAMSYQKLFKYWPRLSYPLLMRLMRRITPSAC